MTLSLQDILILYTWQIFFPILSKLSFSHLIIDKYYFQWRFIFFFKFYLTSLVMLACFDRLLSMKQRFNIARWKPKNNRSETRKTVTIVKANWKNLKIFFFLFSFESFSYSTRSSRRWKWEPQNSTKLGNENFLSR